MLRTIWKIVYNQWPIWVLLLISLYTAFACEFRCLRFITMPFSALQVEKLNDLAKSISLSYVAGMVFYVLSELVPQVRKRYYAEEKLRAMNSNLTDAINSFLTNLCGRCDESNERELVFLATGDDYEKETDILIRKNQLLAFRKLSATTDQLLDAMQACDVYLEMDDYKALLALKTDNDLQLLRDLAQCSEEQHLKSDDMLKCFKAVVEMRTRLANMKVMN